MNWYNKIYQEANEYTNIDGVMSPGNLKDVQQLKANGLSPSGTQTLPGTITNPHSNILSLDYGTRVDACGSEPGAGGCGKDLSEYGEWSNYSVKIGGDSYQAYRCKNCGHSLKPFDIAFSKHPREKKRRKKQRSRRLSKNITERNIREAATPAAPTPGGYNNPANTMLGRLDLTEDQRVIPWNKMEDPLDQEYDSQRQKNNKQYKIVKVKGKNGEYKYIKIKKENTRGKGGEQANVFTHRGRIKKQPRYNPSNKPGKGNPGAWPHNRDDNEGSYGMYVDKNRMNSDMRERVVPWSTYVNEKGNMGLLKPY